MDKNETVAYTLIFFFVFYVYMCQNISLALRKEQIARVQCVGKICDKNVC
jgi:hypothetical protein